MAKGEIARLIPAGHTFILVDEEQWRDDVVRNGYKAVPFLERDGQFWGRPPDDETAVREFERLRRAGANYIVFG